MGEQPIFTCKAHVFQIDPKTRKNWIPASQTAVPVSFFYDSTRSTYRIISVEGTKAIINSTITPNMQFTKTSQKFGQWADSRANTVYGLGFNLESELLKFVEKFKEVKEATRVAYQKVHTGSPGHINGTGNGVHHVGGSPQQSPKHLVSSTTSSTTSSTVTNSPIHVRSQSATTSPAHIIKDTSGNANSLPSSPHIVPTTEAHLKYENDRLKIALAQSSSNAKKWEVELQTLKNNNARLTTALQESTQNVEEWKKQLNSYKDECHRLKKQIEGDSSTNKQDASSTSLLKSKIEKLERENQEKQSEIDRLMERIEKLSVTSSSALSFQKKLQEIEGENVELKEKILSLEHKVNRLSSDEIIQLHKLLGEQLREVCQIHEKITGKITS